MRLVSFSLNDLEYELFKSFGRRKSERFASDELLKNNLEGTLCHLLSQRERACERRKDVEEWRVERPDLDHPVAEVSPFDRHWPVPSDGPKLSNYVPTAYKPSQFMQTRKHRFQIQLMHYETKALDHAISDFKLSEAATIRKLIVEEEQVCAHLYRIKVEVATERVRASDEIDRTAERVIGGMSVPSAPQPAPVKAPEPAVQVRVGHWQGSEWWRLACTAEKGCYTVRFNEEEVQCFECKARSVRPPLSDRPIALFSGAALQALPEGAWERNGKFWRIACGHESQPEVTPFTICRACKKASRRPVTKY